MTHKEKERYSDGGNGIYSTCETKKVKADDRREDVIKRETDK